MREWLDHNAKAGDAVLIQGDFGATCQMVGYARGRGLVPETTTALKRFQLDFFCAGRYDSSFGATLDMISIRKRPAC